MPWSTRMVLMFALAGLLFQWYVGRKSVNAIEAITGLRRRKVRLTAFAVAGWVILYPLIVLGSYFLGLSRVPRALQRSNMLLDALVTYPFWIGVILSVQVALVLIPVDLLRLILFPLYRRHREWWTRTQSWVVIIVLATGSLYVVARVFSDLTRVRTTSRELRVAGLPPELYGFRIAHIADVQADGRTRGRRLDQYAEAVNALSPDLILFAGDLVTSGLDHVEAGAKTLGAMRARHGAYACLGDHDFFSDHRVVTEALERHGVTVLHNVTTLVPVGSTHISLTGVTNVYRQYPTREVLDQIEAQRHPGPVNVFLTHQPSVSLVEFVSTRGYELFAAGHTHGGQIAFHLPGLRVTGSTFETDFVTGFYDVRGMLVSINNGLGLTLAPVRYNASAEVTLITLRPR